MEDLLAACPLINPKVYQVRQHLLWVNLTRRKRSNHSEILNPSVIMSTDAAIVSGVRALWEKGHFQDFTIQVEDRSFMVHKLIMASVSDYFCAMLTGGMAECSKDTVQVGVVTGLAMEELISFIYKDKMELTRDNVAELLHAAMYLQIPTAVKVFVDFMVKNVNMDNCYSLLYILKGYSLTDGVKAIETFIKANARDILKNCNVDHVAYEEFFVLLDDWQGSEMDLYLYLRKWVDSDHANRKQHLNGLLCKIRFCLMSPEELESIQDTDVYKKCPGSWHELIHEAVEYHRLPLHSRVLHDSEQSTVRSKPRLVCIHEFAGYHSCASVNENGKWLSLGMSIPEDCILSNASIVVNNFYLINSVLDDIYWHVFDPRTMSWSRFPVLKYKDHFAAVYHKGFLYILAGKDEYSTVCNSIERFDFQTNQWSSIVNLPDTREYHAACVFQDHIYISGGRHIIDGDDLAKFDCLNIESLSWESKAPMREEDCEHLMCVMKLHQEEVIFVVHEDFEFEYYSVSSDQWTVFFFIHDEFPMETSMCGLVAKGNSVYFIDEHKDGVWINEGQCVEVTFKERGSKVSVTSLTHFLTDVEDLQFYLSSYGAVLSVPEHKIPALVGSETA